MTLKKEQEDIQATPQPAQALRRQPGEVFWRLQVTPCPRSSIDGSISTGAHTPAPSPSISSAVPLVQTPRPLGYLSTDPPQAFGPLGGNPCVDQLGRSRLRCWAPPRSCRKISMRSSGALQQGPSVALLTQPGQLCLQLLVQAWGRVVGLLQLQLGRFSPTFSS